MWPTVLSGRSPRRRDERGVGAVELVVAMPVVMLLFLLLAQWSVRVHHDRVVHAAAREAAVAAASWDGGKEAGQRTATAYLKKTGGDLSNKHVSVNVTATEAVVTVSGKVVSLVPGVDVRVSSTATVPRERFAE